MTAQDVHEILAALGDLPIWLDGGWGVDALLGEQTREHSDLDVAIDTAALETAARRVGRLGFVHAGDEQPGLPARYVLRDAARRQVDFHVLAFDADGDGWQPQLHGPPARWPRDALDARGRIGGRTVRCTSPEFQVESHLYEGYDDLDWAAVVELCERFALPLPPGRAPGFVHERRSAAATA